MRIEKNFTISKMKKAAAITAVIALAFFIALNGVSANAQWLGKTSTGRGSADDNKIGRIYKLINLPIEIFKNTFSMSGNLSGKNNKQDAVGKDVLGLPMASAVKKSQKAFVRSLVLGAISDVVSPVNAAAVNAGDFSFCNMFFRLHRYNIFHILLLRLIISPSLPRGMPALSSIIKIQKNKKMSSAISAFVFTDAGFFIFKTPPNGRFK
jgi:hypothetical protein